jgi:hypothetical protein
MPHPRKGPAASTVMMLILNVQGHEDVAIRTLGGRGRFLGLDGWEWSVTLAGSALIGLVIWLV